MSTPNPTDPTRRLARGHRAPRVLVVDDEADLRELLELTLVGMGLDVDCAADLGEARRLLAVGRFAPCLTDMGLPVGDGLALVAEIGADHQDTPVAVITAFGSAENAVAALKAGAFDYLSKPVGLEALRALVRSALQLSATTEPTVQRVVSGARTEPVAVRAEAPVQAAERAESSADRAMVPSPPSAAGGLLLGVSPAIEAVRAGIARLARSMAPVAITGESGSGKELAARLIHRTGARANQPFVAVNCGAIPENLMESEFFGHRRGAFTGADQDRVGFFQAAHGGTLFLDEVADLPLAMQVKLLRAIQERSVRRVGATAEESVDVRIVSATHQDLARCVAAGRFRQDLYYRLNVIELAMPPLRDRREDVEVLAQAVLLRLAARAGLLAAPRLSSVTLRYLQTYGFPGNVRELENMLERALAFSNGEVINVEDLGLRPMPADGPENERALEEEEEPEEADRVSDGAADTDAAPSARMPVGAAVDRTPVRFSEGGVPESLPDYLDQVERDAISRALEKTRYNRTAAAKLLGISFRALRYRMQRLGIQ
jgi:two-component system response regulator PilR (NtrC family)